MSRRGSDAAAPFQPRRVAPRDAHESVARFLAEEGQRALDDAAARAELKTRFEASAGLGGDRGGRGERRVISMALYGDNDKYCLGAIANADLVGAYFPTWQLRIYAERSVPEAVLDALRARRADVRRVPEASGLEGAAAGMFWRFFVADDPAVDRFIVRDSDSRLNARDAFAVAEWCESPYAAHSVRDHPNHARYLNGGLWGATNKAPIAGKVEALARAFADHDAYGADLVFLDTQVYPLLRHDLLAHDAYTCDAYPGSRPFPTKRPPDFQHVGQVFDATGRPRMDDIDSYIRSRPVPPNCRKVPEWTFG